MTSSKENPSSLTEKDYIRYLYQEAQRHGIHKNQNFYSELIKFVNSPKGQRGLNSFIHLEPDRIGIPSSRISPFKRAF